MRTPRAGLVGSVLRIGIPAGTSQKRLKPSSTAVDASTVTNLSADGYTGEPYIRLTYLVYMISSCPLMRLRWPFNMGSAPLTPHVKEF